MIFTRLVVVIAEVLVPILLGAKYGARAGVACVFAYFCFAMDIALKELIDAENEDEEEEES